MNSYNASSFGGPDKTAANVYKNPCGVKKQMANQNVSLCDPSTLVSALPGITCVYNGGHFFLVKIKENKY